MEGGIARAPGGEVLVDEGMQSTAMGVFAAGDCCQVVCARQMEREQQGQGQRQERHWFQMKLWSQVRRGRPRHCLCLSIYLLYVSPHMCLLGHLAN